GTALGDPIEVAALTSAYRDATAARGFCAIGSVKSNIGHLDAAAGVASLIKTGLALEHGEIPPTLHFETPNPKLDLEASPFYVSEKLQPWPRRESPRRAAVSSFGIGGTNAHVILEEAPPADAGDPAQRRHAPILLSARSVAALDRAEHELFEHLKAHPELDIADVAHTLQVGRRRHGHRAVLVADSTKGAVEVLAQGSLRSGHRAVEEAEGRRCVFMFPGGGVQHLAMGADLYAREPVFRAAVDECAAVLEPLLGEDPVAFLYGAEGTEGAHSEERARRIQGTVMALPTLFAVEYACARLLMSCGRRRRCRARGGLSSARRAHARRGRGPRRCAPTAESARAD
ncbi:MAG: ketoacyl-synthetase C-terminal extension domain-containing protein, partial [Acidobacteriota bacterium]